MAERVRVRRVSDAEGPRAASDRAAGRTAPARVPISRRGGLGARGIHADLGQAMLASAVGGRRDVGLGVFDPAGWRGVRVVTQGQ